MPFWGYYYCKLARKKSLIHTPIITDFRLTQLQNDNLYYNAHGNLVKFNEGRYSWPMPSYNADSTLILGYFYPGSTYAYFLYKYNSNGMMIEASIEDSDWFPTGVKYSFEYSDGKLISARFFRLLLPSGEDCEYPPGNGEPDSPECIWLLKKTIDYLMDNEGNIIEETHKTPDGETIYKVIHEFDQGINIFTHIAPPLFLYWSDEVVRFSLTIMLLNQLKYLKETGAM